MSYWYLGRMYIKHHVAWVTLYVHSGSVRSAESAGLHNRCKTHCQEVHGQKQPKLGKYVAYDTYSMSTRRHHWPLSVLVHCLQGVARLQIRKGKLLRCILMSRPNKVSKYFIKHSAWSESGWGVKGGGTSSNCENYRKRLYSRRRQLEK